MKTCTMIENLFGEDKIESYDHPEDEFLKLFRKKDGPNNKIYEALGEKFCEDLFYYGHYSDGVKLIQFIKDNPEVIEIIEELDQYVGEYNSKLNYEFLFEYLLLHNTLDKIVWCARLEYSDKKTIKSKKYRLDILLQEMLNNNIDSFTGKAFGREPGNEERAKFHMKKAWYNELVRSVPFTEGFLEMGMRLDKKGSKGYGFGWNITQSYYSFYEYLNSICFCFEENINTKEHTKTINLFNNSILSKIEHKTLFYPFNISNKYVRGKKYPKHNDFLYAEYPRGNHQNLEGLEDDLVRDFSKICDTSRGNIKSTVDFFKNLRTWANYTGINTLTRLNNGGYMMFMHKNLSVLVFMFAAISEITFIKKYGVKKIIDMLYSLNIEYISKNEEYSNIDLNPIFMRFKIYKNMGIIPKDTNLDFIEKRSNSIQFIN